MLPHADGRVGLLLPSKLPRCGSHQATVAAWSLEPVAVKQPYAHPRASAPASARTSPCHLSATPFAAARPRAELAGLQRPVLGKRGEGEGGGGHRRSGGLNSPGIVATQGQRWWAASRKTEVCAIIQGRADGGRGAPAGGGGQVGQMPPSPARVDALPVPSLHFLPYRGVHWATSRPV